MSYDTTMTSMTPDDRDRLDRALARLDELQGTKAERDARAQERERLKIQSHIALERLHRANAALREALPY
jgi:hypothetical protein